MKYLLILSCSFILSYSLTPLMGWIALKFNILDQPGTRKIHTEPKPRTGGIAIYLSFLIIFALAHRFNLFTRGFENEFTGLLLGSSIVFLTGMIDDIRGLNAWIKLGAQIFAGLILVIYGIRISLFIPNVYVSSIITILWVVGITNSFNLLDNMDGLSAGVGGISSLMFFLVYGRQGLSDLNLLMMILVGSLIGFLKYNFNPARIFMGDAGSLFIGFIIGGTAAMGGYLKGSLLTRLPVITPLLILGVPIFDTLSVIYIRIKQHRSIFSADKSHFSHRLVTLGMTQKQAVLFIYLVSFCVGINSILLPRITRGDALVILIQALAIFAIIVLLMIAKGDELKRKIRKKEI
ncbi:undecaprenyl-phosphate alpha-N-acetylglucosaminyl 1-phosphate transferase [Candidatus Desantisbacteria bacterium CG07_land_8_20_14_0_80_39_15]|uniref:Undecaprenyl-phosphate alpha-N-acetylglucosaminyl 1-phosphate transferase n=1 Tax=Candidatus Desantisbacteria bacterium CG07_land_8_20_14_0_80_39_15 TaxID=1974549 RepID=A0A2M6ZEH1_9BACT|nr:MAG: undecaprenyl-phosphate alpha-N-acetylglucosaminyl 1-phosphate transferase [Candidatus Desantisbacteria bacterium CG07_land_8_20_14_0_80_39_15]